MLLRSVLLFSSALLLGGCQLLWTPSPAALVGTTWQVVELQGEPYAVAAGEPVLSLHLQPDGHVSAYGGCNQLLGDYQRRRGGVLRVWPLRATHKDCTPAALALEKSVVRALEGASSYTYEGSTLSLRNPIGIALVRFQPAGMTTKTAAP
jgi:heat shock protein HslJ